MLPPAAPTDEGGHPAVSHQPTARSDMRSANAARRGAPTHRPRATTRRLGARSGGHRKCTAAWTRRTSVVAASQPVQLSFHAPGHAADLYAASGAEFGGAHVLLPTALPQRHKAAAVACMQAKASSQFS